MNHITARLTQFADLDRAVNPQNNIGILAIPSTKISVAALLSRGASEIV